jgi:hypothetical protein
MFSFVSIVIAFIATAGAIPLCRNLVGRLRGRADDDLQRVAPPVAGAGILFGIFIALFYFGSDPHGAVTSVFDVLASPSRNLLLAGMALLTPVAVFLLGRPQGSGQALPLGLALVQLLLLSVFGALVAPDPTTWTPYKGFETVALPTIGALMAALIYLCRTPWRATPNISVGIATRVFVGLLVAWGALMIGAAPWAQAERTAALLWILAVPLFELLHRYLAASIRRPGLLPKHSPASILIFALAAGGVGIALWHMHVAAASLQLALLPALLIYVAAPKLMLPWKRHREPAVVDAPGPAAQRTADRMLS